MGVRGLKTYLERNCPDACYEANISKIVQNYWIQNRKRAEIVVDAHSCFSMWYQGLDWTIGIEVQQLIQRLRSFVNSFRDIDVDLVFFFDGLTPEKKRRTWLTRRRTYMHKMMNVFDMLNTGRSYQDIPEEWDYIPPNMANFVAYVLRHVLNCTVYIAVDDCDEEIIQYVYEENSFAIFSNDTDFVVSNVDCFVLSAEDFNSSQMTTMLYDRSELAQYLNIEDVELPLLAILAGNDYIDYETLKPFHFQQCNWSPNNYHIPYKILFSSLGEYINSLPEDVSTDELMNTICEDVFDDTDKAGEMELAYNSYFPDETSDDSAFESDSCSPTDSESDLYSQSYSYSQSDSESDSYSQSNSESESDYPPFWSRVLDVAEERLRNVLLPVSAWGVLTRQVYESSVCLEDFRDTNDDNEDPEELPSATVTRALRERLYGILLYEIRNFEPTVTEWCGENEESYQEPAIVTPEYTTAHHPGLRALWDESRSNTHYGNKWTLFLRGISQNHPIYNYEDWMSLPPDLVVSSATCYYLYMEEDFLQEWELEAVLATLAMYPYDRNRLDTIYKGDFDLRAIQISVTFSRTYSLVFSMMATCGYPVPLSEDTAHMKFEPKLFQYIYERRNNGDEDTIDELFGYDYDQSRRFHQMCRTILN